MAFKALRMATLLGVCGAFFFALAQESRLRPDGRILVTGGRAEPGTQTGSLPESASVKGSVFDAVTGEPVAKVRLVLAGVDIARIDYSTASDASGRFRFTDVAPGRYRLWASKNRYARLAYGKRRNDGLGAILTLGPGQEVTGLVLKIVPAAVITGRVLDEDGEPVAFAQVDVLRYRYVNGERRLRAVSRGARTNDLGEYRLFGLAPGRYYVSVSYGGGRGGFRFRRGREDSPERSRAYPRLYYPGVPDPAQAVALEIKAGEERQGIDFRLTPMTAVRVSGRVHGGAGRVIVALRREGEPSWRTRGPLTIADRKTGEFAIGGVLPGTYLLEAVAAEGDVRRFARLPLTVANDDVRDLVLELRPGVNVSGRVGLDSDGPPTVLQKIRVALSPASGSPFFQGRGGRVDREGRFEIREVGPGRYRVDVSGIPDTAYLASVTLEGRDVLERGLEVPEGGVAGLEVAIGLQGGVVTGAVRDEDGKPVLGASVVLAPAAERRYRLDLFKSVTTDQYGRFLIEGVAPGEYKIFAFDDVESGAWRAPEFLEQWDDSGQEIELEKGGRQAVELELITLSPEER